MKKSPLAKLKAFDKSRSAAGKKAIFIDKKKDDKNNEKIKKESTLLRVKQILFDK